MKFNIRGKKLEVTDALKSYVEEKIGKLDKYFSNPDNIEATVLIKVHGKDQIVEVTINTHGLILRGEETSKDLYSSIDLVVEKIERQIRKNKTRLHKKITKDKSVDFMINEEPEEVDANSVVKRKIIDVKPMSEEEAILQMELLGHDFFAFKNTDNSDINVLYRRKDGNYGILETK